MFEDNENNLDSLFGASVSEMLHSAELSDSFCLEKETSND